MIQAASQSSSFVFDTALGYFGITVESDTLRQVVFGFSSSEAAWEALKTTAGTLNVNGQWRDLADRLTAFAAGEVVDFNDVPIAHGAATPFQRRVVQVLRSIPWGQTISYGDLAGRSGALGAARAVGNIMAQNCFPIVVPCHRVVHADGRIGRFSAPGGAVVKERLLAMEARGQIFRLAEARKYKKASIRK